jgi:type IV pilus assembly protein PilV
MRSKRSSQLGASLIEIVVSIFVLSIGLLGMAGMASVSSANNKMSQIRSTANLLVSDYADRARSNLTGFDAGSYALSDVYEYRTTLRAVTGCNNAMTAACNATAIATFDKDQWRNTLMRRLPGGNAFATTNYQVNGNLRSLDLWIMWSEVETTDAFGLNNVYLCPTAANAPSSVRCLYFRIAL